MASLTQDRLASSLYSWWDETASSSAITLYPGVDRDSAETSEWVELWIETVRHPRQRNHTPLLLDVTVTVHCYSREPFDLSLGQKLAESVRAQLSQQVIPLFDFEESLPLEVGYLKLNEPDIMNMTRSHLEQQERPLQHYVVMCRGVAQELLQNA